MASKPRPRKRAPAARPSVVKIEVPRAGDKRRAKWGRAIDQAEAVLRRCGVRLGRSR